jgi:1-acyl-sn-glycerol-3-phosphate acyltransferase
VASFPSEDVRERLERIDLRFSRYGLDPYGISREHLAWFYTGLGWLYRHYFRVRVTGMEHVPAEGPALLVGNHSGGLPVDGGMVLASLFFDHEPPRHAHAMVELFAQRWPFLSPLFCRIGQLPGVPAHLLRMLSEGRLVMVFPEGARGTGKLYRDRYRLVRFGTGFVRLALQAGVPIVPFAFIGGEEALPTVLRLERLGRAIGAPYVPVPPHIVPVPLPVACQIHFGEPLRLPGDGSEPDEITMGFVEDVKERIRALIARGLDERTHPFDVTGLGRRLARRLGKEQP